MKPHKHAKEIKAWADGAEIEWLLDKAHSTWVFDSCPSWFENTEYRIKPQPKPDVVLYTHISNCDFIRLYRNPHTIFNLKVILCAETGDLKSAEVIE